jgi:nucleoside-diphosphate-sugar epimerase
MNILVTGGAGYVGSTLVTALLAAGHSVRVLDCLAHGGLPLLAFWSQPGFSFLRGDVRDEGLLRQALHGVDAVVHLAAIVGDPACARQPELAQEINLKASSSLLAESQRAGVSRFLFASTCSNYGKMKDAHRLVDETSELAPVSLYAETKVAVERLILNSTVGGGLCATCLRFATIFGVSARMRFDLTVNEFVMELLTKHRLLVFGEQFWRPYIHVRDAARAIMNVLGAREEVVHSEVFNVGSSEQNYQKRQLVELMRPYAPEATVEYVHKEEDPRDYRVSFAKIKETLGFEVSMSVPDGIREVVQLIKDGVISDYGDPAYRN